MVSEHLGVDLRWGKEKERKNREGETLDLKRKNSPGRRRRGRRRRWRAGDRPSCGLAGAPRTGHRRRTGQIRERALGGAPTRIRRRASATLRPEAGLIDE